MVMSKGGSSVSTPDPDDYMGIINAEANANRINQDTPYGSYEYKQPKTMKFNRWKKQNPGKRTDHWQPGTKNEEGRWVTSKPDYVGGYNDYKAGQSKKGRVEFKYSDEVQNMFDKQFDPNSYDQYSDEYMGRYNELIAPGRENQLDRFEQSMSDRGLPEGGEVYGDLFRTKVGDPNSRMDLMAEGQAQGVSDKRRLDDFNRLMQAMGGSKINSPNLNTTSAANMAMNADAQNAAQNNQQESDMWNTAAQAGMMYMMMGCSHEYKENKRPFQTLDKLAQLSVEEWSYKAEFDDPSRHASPYAEEVRDVFGLGDGKTIPVIDLIGITLKAVQELAAEVKELKCRM